MNGWAGIIIAGSNCTHNLLMVNNSSDNFDGVWIEARNNTISANNLQGNAGAGITLESYRAVSNKIIANLIHSNYNGINIQGGSNHNLIFNNTFINNLEANAEDDGNNNQWDNGSLGNYWDDYQGVDANDDGIGDSPYAIEGAAAS